MKREALKNVRKEANRTCQEVAAAIGVSKVYYWQVENGKRNLYYGLAVKIASYFGKKPDDIFLPEELTNAEQDQESGKEVG